MENLITPHGGTLCNLLVDDEQAEALKKASGTFLNVTLSQRHMCDLELLLCGGLSPLRGFMDQASYESVISEMRLPDGSLWSIPITFDVPAKLAEKIEPGQRLALCDGEGFMVAA
ncbi:MAG: adenylyltransferase, partial [Gammaproteobacteria bacterium]